MMWRESAACLGTDLDFHPDPEADSSVQRALCAQCPVVDACLTYALERNERYGIWGGLTEKQRARMRRHWDRRVCRKCHCPIPIGKAVLCDGCRRENRAAVVAKHRRSVYTGLSYGPAGIATTPTSVDHIGDEQDRLRARAGLASLDALEGFG